MFLAANIKAVLANKPGTIRPYVIKAQTLLDDIRKPLSNERPPKIFTDQGFIGIISLVDTLLRNNPRMLKNDYHNWHHAWEVYRRVTQLCIELGFYDPFRNLDQGDPAAINDLRRTQLLQLAALFHDYDHCGRTVRNVGDGLTNEEAAACAADRVARMIGLSIEQRLELYCLIISTTYGDKLLQNYDHGNNPRSFDFLKKVLAFADLSGFTKLWDKEQNRIELGPWIDEMIAVMKESTLDELSSTFEEWCGQKLLFLGLARSKLPCGITRFWRMLLQEAITILTSQPEQLRDQITPYLRK